MPDAPRVSHCVAHHELSFFSFSFCFLDPQFRHSKFLRSRPTMASSSPLSFSTFSSNSCFNDVFPSSSSPSTLLHRFSFDRSSPSRSVSFTPKSSNFSGNFSGDDPLGFYPWESSGGDNGIEWEQQETITLFTADGLVQIGGLMVPKRVSSSQKKQAKVKTSSRLQQFKESNYMDPAQGLCLGALFDIAATNGLDMGRRLCIIGFCRSIEMLSDVVEDTVLEHGGEGYGMTESGGIISIENTRVGSRHSGSSGALCPGMESQIINIETLKPLPPNQLGEIWIRGLNLMQGYFLNKEATEQTIDKQGWLHTGDLGYFDEQGRIYVVDRLKELIKYKGFQVAPAELEGLLVSHPEIMDAAVIPYPDEEAGEIPMACVVCKPGSSLTGEEVQIFIAKQVAPFKRIRKVAFVDIIPKAASGKILRRELRQKVQSKL